MKRNASIFHILFVLLFCQALSAQNASECAIKITNNGVTGQFFYIYFYSSKSPVDSSFIQPEASACFNIQDQYPLFSIITQREGRNHYFFKQKDTPVQVRYLKSREITVENSPLNDAWLKARVHQDSAMKEILALRGNNEVAGTFLRCKNDYEKWAYETFVSFIQADTFLALRFLNFHLAKLQSVVFTNPKYMDSLKIMLEGLQVERHPLVIGANPYEQIAALSYLRTGADMYHFNLRGIRGDTLSTQQFGGSKLLIDFWASWCKPCREKNRILKKHFDTLKSKGIQILGVSLDDQEDIWLSALEKDQLPWVQGMLWPGDKKKIQQQYNAHAIPLSLLFSEKGKLLEINPSVESLMKL